MKKQTSLHIDTPCHEDWNQMIPAEKGRFCAQCSRQVTDFTQMTDQQILTYLSSHSGRLCGRLEESQLNRALTEIQAPKKRSWYIALSLPLLLLFQKSSSQLKNRTTSKETVIAEQRRTILGDTIMPVYTTQPAPAMITVEGTVTDEKGAPLWSVSIVQKNTSRGVITDSAGRFSIQVPVSDSEVTLEASYIGYASAEKKINTNDIPAPVNISLSLQPAFLGEVVTVGMIIPKRYRKIQDQSNITCKKISSIEKADSALQKITGSGMFTVYPNPALAGSLLNISIKKKGQYELQFLDNSSALLKNKMINTTGDGVTSSFEIPAQLPAGIYYLRLINTDNRKSYLEKVMIR